MSLFTPNDTIVAVATAPGPGAISIVRLSGQTCLLLADRLIRPPAPKPSQQPPHSFFRTTLHDPRKPDIILDQAIILIFRAPHSYTGEDLVEFQIHGGPIQSRRLLRTLIDCGARPADPGEFTQRAFLNGKMDLVQAEGVADLINSHSDRASILALDQIQGNISDCIKLIYDDLMTISSNVENSIDFSDDDFPADIIEKSSLSLQRALDRINHLISSWGQGRMIREGILVVITGPPNVGKSTLMNKLLGFDRAIVTDIPGTTRDIIEEGLVLDGFQIRLADTAGIRDTDCKIEKIGIERAQLLLQKADVIINMIDASQINQNALLSVISAENSAKSILFANKTDIASLQQIKLLSDYSQNIIMGSLVKESGLDDLKKAIIAPVKSTMSTIHSYSISERHYNILSQAKNEIVLAQQELDQNRMEALVLVSSHLRSALELIGTINGLTYSDQLLENIFSKFCIGK